MVGQTGSQVKANIRRRRGTTSKCEGKGGRQDFYVEKARGDCVKQLNESDNVR